MRDGRWAGESRGTLASVRAGVEDPVPVRMCQPSAGPHRRPTGFWKSSPRRAARSVRSVHCTGGPAAAVAAGAGPGGDRLSGYGGCAGGCLRGRFSFLLSGRRLLVGGGCTAAQQGDRGFVGGLPLIIQSPPR